jgi:hypothetical protein
MNRRGPQGKGSEARIKSFIANTIANRPDEIRSKRGKISSTIIARLFHEETGEEVTRQTVAKYIADKDFINYTQATIPESNTRMEEINKRIAIAKNISDDITQKAGDRCKALNTFNSLTKTKIDYEEKLLANKLRQAEIKRPIHQVVFGHFENVEKICPECGHRFYDLPVEKKAKQKEFKSGDDQDTLDGGKKNADDKSK